MRNLALTCIIKNDRPLFLFSELGTLFVKYDELHILQ
jgi:hypothetical protein